MTNDYSEGHELTQEECREAIARVIQELERVLIGQKDFVLKLLMALLMEGHILIEGVPGLAKTTAVRALSQVVKAGFKRIQFTPDLLPADLLGTQIYNPKTQEFTIKKGPIFSNIILADEINRAPAKVQSALLEVMQEKQVTLGEETFKLSSPFFVLATQNPLEQEGTYPLPEAQLDRFAFKIILTYPTAEEELKIMKRYSRHDDTEIKPVIENSTLQRISERIDAVTVDDKLEQYIIRLVHATRMPEKYHKDYKGFLKYGASPRAAIILHKAVRTLALIEGRDYVLPQDVKRMAPDVLRHRIGLAFEAQADGITTDDIIQGLLQRVPLA